MRVCLMFGVIVSATFCMRNSRDYAEFHEYMIAFIQDAAIWALLALVARIAWKLSKRERIG